MAFKLGQTREDIEKEQAQQLLELEAEINQRNRVKQEKLGKYKRKNRRNKIIIVVLIILIFLSFLTFGTYNTFIKQPLSAEDVQSLIQSSEKAYFDTSGIQGFITNNTSYIRDNYIKLSNDNLENLKLDKNSVAINKIQQLDRNTAIVYFSIDIETKEKDTKDNKNNLLEGKIEVIPYQFRVIVRDVSVVEGETHKYSFASDIELVDNNNIFTTGDITTTPYFDFNGLKQDEENIMVAKQTKIDRILSDLYEGKDVRDEFGSKQLVPSNGNIYKGISSFISYQSNNALGFNAVCTYIVETASGFTYTNVCYLAIEANGEQSYKITKYI
jgi:hypothetical protein